MTLYFLLSLVIVTLLGGVGCYYARRPVIYMTALILVALFIPLGYGSISSLMGRPKPVELEWLHPRVEEALVLGSVVREGVGIFAFMVLPGQTEPMSYKLPWDEKTAEQLQKAEAESARNGTKGAVVRLPFEATLDRDAPRFYAVPQPKMPDKGPAEEEKPQVFERAT